MQLKEAQKQDPLTNLMIRSSHYMTEGVQVDHKLNYNKVYENPKQYQVSYVDALANLQEIKQLFKKRITDKNPNYNFFLDDSDNADLLNGITPDEYTRYEPHARNGKMFAYTLKDTWTKGKDFFFIQKGCVLQLRHLYEDRVFVDVSYRGMVGLMKLVDLKIILAEDVQD